MPKTWESYKAEIYRLYMEEGLPLKEVRGVMIEIGFNALYVTSTPDLGKG
jgi:hypothetical protein